MKARSLEIDEDLHSNRRNGFSSASASRCCFLFVLAALLGFTGMGGPMSHGEAGEPGGPVHVEYERFVRRNAQATIKVHLRGAPGDVRFWISSPYFEHVRVDSFVPAPQLVSVETDRHVYLIRAGFARYDRDARARAR